MPLTCTDFYNGAAPHQRRGLRRGVAEIETLLVILFVVLPILFIVVYAGSLGITRLGNIFSAEDTAYSVAVKGSAGRASDPVPVVAENQPNLPSRFAMADQVQVVNQSQGRLSAILSPVKIEDRAWFLDSSWHYPSNNNDDQTAIHDWFNAYVDQDHSDTLDYALGISPPGPP